MNGNYKYPSKDPMVKLEQEMKLRGFSKNTTHSYLHYITEIIRIANKSPKNINTEDVRSYLEQLADGGSSSSTLNCAYSALKFYFEKILHRKFFVNIPRAKKDKKLPVVLSREEVRKMIDVIDNPKHKCVIQLLYGCGLRISEVVKIRMEDIDCQRQMLYIRKAKGNKDRYTVLPEKLIEVLEQQKVMKDFNDYLSSTFQNTPQSLPQG